MRCPKECRALLREAETIQIPLICKYEQFPLILTPSIFHNDKNHTIYIRRIII